MGFKTDEIWEDVWVNTACSVCYCGCGIKVRRINGLPVKIEGISDSTMGGANAGICGKGAAGLMYYYDPNRIKRPLRRTNPEKGIGVDPKWKEISWEEAYEEIAERMKKIMADNPNKILFCNQTVQASVGPHQHPYFFAKAFGVKDNGNFIIGGGSLHCGNAAHMLGGLIHGAWSIAPDWRYTKLVLKWGSEQGDRLRTLGDDQCPASGGRRSKRDQGNSVRSHGKLCRRKSFRMDSDSAGNGLRRRAGHGWCYRA